MTCIKQSSKIMAIVLGFLVILTAGSVFGQPDNLHLMPKVQWVTPPGVSTTGYKAVPPSFTVAVDPVDPDAPDGRPVRIRYLVKSAMYEEGRFIRTPFDFNLHGYSILTMDDPEWSDWMDVPPAPDLFEVSFAELPIDEYFLISFQVLDADGAVSDPFQYQISTLHVRVQDPQYFRPEVTVYEPFLGQHPSTEAYYEIASDQPLNFSWIGDASSYGGEIASYRHGWDLIDVDDPNDPGWSVPPGLANQNLFDMERSFSSGIHVFYLRVEDDAGRIRLMIRILSVVPFVDPQFQLPLLVLDQTVDSNVYNWPDQQGNPRNDETYRNAFWHFLAEGSGGVAGIHWDRDWFNHTDQVGYSDLVKYKAVLCYAKSSDNQRMFNELRPTGGPVDGQDRFVWLAPYQFRGGNFFLVGGSSMESFIEGAANYMVPMIFDTHETYYTVDGRDYVVGFGTSTSPDGSVVQRGPRLYPYAVAGISALDWTSSNTKNIYGRILTARHDRNVDCVGLKGIVLDENFKFFHGIGPGVIADTIWTDPEIDWQDPLAVAGGTLDLFSGTFPYRYDEFYDGNISTRSTGPLDQNCDAFQAPSGLCVEPMWRGVSRFDWMREHYRNQGSDWPASHYSEWDLQQGCGPLGLTDHQGEPLASARTNGQTYGFFSYKTIDDKPSAKADVYWGFDPYRFQPEEAKKAIRWVLQYFGLGINP